jgi:hypothetical protein
VLPTEALRSIYLLIFPLDVPTLLVMEFGIAACNSLFPLWVFRDFPGVACSSRGGSWARDLPGEA